MRLCGSGRDHRTPPVAHSTRLKLHQTRYQHCWTNQFNCSLMKTLI